MKLSWPARWKVFLSGSAPLPEVRSAFPVLRQSVVGSYNGFTFALWQQSNEHIKYAQELFKQEKFRDLLAVLSNASPIVDQKNPDAYAKELGRFLGYRELLSVLLALPRFPEATKQEVEADYSAEEIVASEQLPEYET